MAERRKFPPLDDPARFDAIVGRGRRLRRRRQIGVGAGAGGSVAAVALAVVLVTGNGGGGDRIRHDIVADDDQLEAVETTTTTTTTTVPAALPSEFTAQVEVDGDELVVTLTDPAQPASGDSKQCVYLTLEGSTGATEVVACDNMAPAVDGEIPVEVPNTDALIGCAATLDPARPVPEETEPKSTTFRMTVPSDLAPGEYSVTVSATSGIGDGCAGTGDEAEPGTAPAPGAAEYTAEATTTITLG